MKYLRTLTRKVRQRLLIFLLFINHGAWPLYGELSVAKRWPNSSHFGVNLASSSSWIAFNGTFAMESGAVKLVNTTTTATNSACKIINLNQTQPKVLRISARSKAQGVSELIDPVSYSLRADVIYADDSTELYQHTPFRGGSHDWQEGELFLFPKKPIKQIKVIVMLYWRTGTVWFDDVVVQQETVAGTLAKFDDTPTVNVVSGEGYLVREFAPEEHWYGISNSTSGNGWSLAESSTTSNGIKVHTATLANQAGGERAGVLAYRIPLPGSGYRWCDADLRTQTTANEFFTEYTNENPSEDGPYGVTKRRSKFLWGCVVNNITGHAIAIDPEYPAQFRIRYDSTTRELFVVFDLGFADGVDSATVKFATWEFDPSAGMRQAVSDFYKMHPGSFRDELLPRNIEHGNWFIKNLSTYLVPNSQDFGFKFNQHNISQGSLQYDEASGILDTHYVHPTELFMSIANLGGNPTYSQVVGRLDALASGSYVDPSDPSAGTTAQTIQNSAVKDSNGNYVYHTGALWSPTFARFLMNPAPGIPGRNAYYDQWTNPAIQSYLTTGTMDGIMFDNVEASYWSSAAVKTKIDYSHAHFAAMQTPLVHDKSGRVGICYEMAIWEYLNAIRNDISTRSKFLVVQANGASYSTTFLVPKLHLTGGEQTWDYPSGWHPANEAALLRFRAQAGRKPVAFLQEMDDISSWTEAMTTKYLARCAAFGILPSIYNGGADPASPKYFDEADSFERDRHLFRTYMPVIKKLSQAGWEPARLGSVNDGEVFFERFGTEYLTIFNPASSAKNVTINYPSAPINFTGKDLITGTDVDWVSGQTTLLIGSEAVAVLEVPARVAFRLEEGASGSIFAEIPYNIISGSLAPNGAVWTGHGVSGTALNFDGTNGYAHVPDHRLLDISDNGLTYSAWVKANGFNPAGHSMVLCKGGNQYLSVTSGVPLFKIITSGTIQRYCSGTSILQPNTWYHVAATYDREGYMKVFVNGKQEGATQGPFLNPINNTSPLRIGDFVGTGRFNGTIDEVETYRKGMNEKEIRRVKDRAISVYHLPLREGAGTIAYDSFNPQKQAAIHGATWHGNTALEKPDNSLYFDGVDDYLDLPGSQAAFTTGGVNGFSYSAWIKGDTAFPAGHAMLLAKGDTYLSVYNGALLFKMLTDTSSQRYCASSMTLSPNNWHHVAAVYESTGLMKVYVDGVLRQTNGPYPNPINQAAGIQIARGFGSNYFKGILKEVRVYKRGLTGDEVKLLYENQE